MLGSRRRVLSSALPLLLSGLLFLGAPSAQAQLRGVGSKQDEFGNAVRDYYNNAAASLGRGLVVGDDDAWAPVVRIGSSAGVWAQF